MKIKTADLIGPALDWAVATIEGYGGLRRNPHAFDQSLIMNRGDGQCVLFSTLNYSTDWSQGGPIIEREKLEVRANDYEWQAFCFGFPTTRSHSGQKVWASGPTPLIAAMRCVVAAANLGDEIYVPNELV